MREGLPIEDGYLVGARTANYGQKSGADCRVALGGTNRDPGACSAILDPE